METLDLPTITDPAPDVAPAAGVPATVDLKKIDLKAVALAQFGDWRADVAAAKQNLSTLVLDLSIPARIAEAKSLRQRLINAPIADARAVSKALKSRLAQVSKDVGAEEEAAVAAYTETGTLITPKIEAAEKRIEEERQRKEREEEQRIEALKLAVDGVLDPWLDRCNAEGMTAERVQAGAAALGELAMPAEFADVAGYWAERLSITSRSMESRRLALAAAELEAQQAKVRAEAQRVAGIQARIAEIQAAATGHDKASSADLAEARTAVDALRIDAEVYAEFLPLAQAARSMTLLALDGLQVAAVAREAAEAEAKREARAQEAIDAGRAMAEAIAAAAKLPALPLERVGQIMRDLAQPLPLTIPDEPEFTEGQGIQQVLKAEGASPDATDRDAPAATSPCVGTMGAGQAADAAPAGEPPHVQEEAQEEAHQQDHSHPAAGDDCPGSSAQPATPEVTHATFLALVMSAFDCKFPSHPKPSAAWWAAVRAAGEKLQGL